MFLDTFLIEAWPCPLGIAGTAIFLRSKRQGHETEG
jgi:hypothetical protein